MTYLLADNQDITRQGLKSIIQGIAPGASLEEVPGREALVHALKACPAATVVLDMALFDIAGTDTLLILMSRFAAARWVLFSSDFPEALLRRTSGMYGVSLVGKECRRHEIEAALRYGAPRFVSPALQARISESHTAATQNLTPAEAEVLRLIAMGHTVKEVAAMRCSSFHTIVAHKKNIFRKLGVNTVYDATRHALRSGLVDPVEYYI